MAGRAGGASRASRIVAVVAVAALAAGAIALSAVALQHADPDAPTGTPAPVPTFDLGVETGTALPPPAAAPAADPVTEPPGANERFLSIDSGGMWRATAGECGVTAPIVERSVDGGSTWTDVTPTYRDIGQVHGLDAFAGTEAEMVATMNDTCTIDLLRTFTQGRFWEPYPEVLAASTYLSAEDPGLVVTPEGELAAPCDAAWSLRASGDTIALICDDVAYRLADDGWGVLTDTTAFALTVVDSVVVVAHAGADCPALAITRFEGDPSDETCLDAQALPGAIALAATSEETVAWIGNEILPVG